MELAMDGWRCFYEEFGSYRSQKNIVKKSTFEELQVLRQFKKKSS